MTKLNLDLLKLFFWAIHFKSELFTFNSVTPMGDQDIISPYNINTVSSKQVMRINKYTN